MSCKPLQQRRGRFIRDVARQGDELCRRHRNFLGVCERTIGKSHPIVDCEARYAPAQVHDFTGGFETDDPGSLTAQVIASLAPLAIGKTHFDGSSTQ